VRSHHTLPLKSTSPAHAIRKLVRAPESRRWRRSAWVEPGDISRSVSDPEGSGGAAFSIIARSCSRSVRLNLGRLIHVSRQYTHGKIVEHGKTDAASRDIGIDGKLAAELTAWKLQQKPERREDDSLVIATATGEPMSASNFLSRDFRLALKRAKLPRVNFHSLRHTAATILASSNIPPGTVHRILGHANFATTMKLYGGLTSEALDKAAGALGDAFEPKKDLGVKQN
jgi:integrase